MGVSSFSKDWFSLVTNQLTPSCFLHTDFYITRLAEHLDKIEQARKAGGYTSSMEREVEIFQKSIDAIKQILARKP